MFRLKSLTNAENYFSFKNKSRAAVIFALNILQMKDFLHRFPQLPVLPICDIYIDHFIK
jgi:hypothetical protein